VEKAVATVATVHHATTKQLAPICLLICLCQACRPVEQKLEPTDKVVQAPRTELQGVWVELRALAKEKPKGKSGYFVWVFDENRVARRNQHTMDGEPESASVHVGTFKVDATVMPKAIDIDGIENEKILGIYELNGDTLKLCVGSKRPKTFEEGDLFVLKRPPKEQ
jgi:uncharacterized protein (TIGR03067 family)